MQLSKCNSSSGLDESLRRMAARATMGKIVIQAGSNWATAKPIIEAGLKKAIQIGPIEEIEVQMLLKRLAAGGVKIGDGSKEAITKEAQGFMGWMGQQIGNAGQWMADKGKGIQDHYKNKPLNDAKQKVDSAAVALRNAIQELSQIDQNMGAQLSQTMEVPLRTLRQSTQTVAGEIPQVAPANPTQGQQPPAGQTPAGQASQQQPPPGIPNIAPNQYGTQTLELPNTPGDPSQIQPAGQPLPAQPVAAPAAQQPKPLGTQQPAINNPQFQNATPQQQQMMQQRRDQVHDPMRQQIRDHNQKNKALPKR